MNLDRILDRLLDRTRRLDPGYREPNAPPWVFSVLSAEEMDRFEELHVRWLYHRDPKRVPRERYSAGWPFDTMPDEPLSEEDRLELDRLLRRIWRGSPEMLAILEPGDLLRLVEIGPKLHSCHEINRTGP